MQVILRRGCCRKSSTSLLPAYSQISSRYSLSASNGSDRRKLSNAAKDDGNQLIKISKTRLDELLKAEVEHLGTVPMQPLSIKEVLKNREPHLLVKFIQIDVPRRFAMRLRMIQFLKGWEQVAELREIHGQLKRWYEILTLAPGNLDIKDFTERVETIRAEGRVVVQTVATGIRKLKQTGFCDHTDEFLDRWIDGFLLSRIGSNMLLDQYRATVPREYGGRVSRPTGIIDVSCDASIVCGMAARLAQELCEDQWGRAPSFEVETYVAGKYGPQPPGTCVFSYVPGYLRYILLELFKNSFNATVKHVTVGSKLPEVAAVICCDAHRVAIRISDRGGGIPFDKGAQLWSYMHGAAADSEMSGSPSPLAGYGVGLPVSRLHAQYLGGKLHITTYPGYGTDAHLLLPRISALQVEKMPAGY